jgi:hypothetical protein
MKPEDYEKGATVRILAKSHKNKTGKLIGIMPYGRLSVEIDHEKGTRPSYLVFDAVDLELTET